jgi:hypothetical protein
LLKEEYYLRHFNELSSDFDSLRAFAQAKAKSL